jgi:hypothetical protein
MYSRIRIRIKLKIGIRIRKKMTGIATLKYTAYIEFIIL